MLREKYFFREACGGRGTYWGWKGIFEARKVLDNGIRWRVGDETCINIREDRGSLNLPLSRLGRGRA